MIIPKEETRIQPNEEYERNKKFYELNKAGMSYTKIAFSEEHNPTKLSASRIGNIILAFKKRHTTEGVKKN